MSFLKLLIRQKMIRNSKQLENKIDELLKILKEKKSFWSKPSTPYLIGLITLIISFGAGIITMNLQRSSDLEKVRQNMNMEFVLGFNRSFYDECIHLSEKVYYFSNCIFVTKNSCPAEIYDSLKMYQEKLTLLINENNQSIDTNVIVDGNNYLQKVQDAINVETIHENKFIKFKYEKLDNLEIKKFCNGFKRVLFNKCIQNVKLLN